MRWPAMELSLRVKLVLSYLGVALGAILLLVVVISLAVQNYFYSVQIGQLRSDAEINAQQIGLDYQRSSESWAFTNIAGVEEFYPNLVLVVDTSQQMQITHVPRFTSLSATDLQTAKQSLAQSTQGQETNGSLQGSPQMTPSFQASMSLYQYMMPGLRVEK